MKNSISFILELFLTFFLFILSIFISLFIIFKTNIIIDIYKVKGYPSFLSNISYCLDNMMLDDSLLNDIKDYFTKEVMTRDLKALKMGQEISCEKQINNILSNYDIASDTKESLAKKVNDLYKEEIFPSKTYILFQKYLNIKIIFYLLIFCLLLSIFLLLLNGCLYRIFLSNFILYLILVFLIFFLYNENLFIKIIFNLLIALSLLKAHFYLIISLIFKRNSV